MLILATAKITPQSYFEHCQPVALVQICFQPFKNMSTSQQDLQSQCHLYMLAHHTNSFQKELVAALAHGSDTVNVPISSLPESELKNKLTNVNI